MASLVNAFGLPSEVITARKESPSHNPLEPSWSTNRGQGSREGRSG